MNTQYVYLNGQILAAQDATVSPFDIGLLRGYAVFDLLRTVGGRPFLLAEHLDRLRASAAQLGLTVPVSDAAIGLAIDELLERNGHGEATVRLVLTGGVSPNGMSYDPSTPTFYILTQELHELPAVVYETGGKLITHEHRREMPEAKTTAYLTMIKNRARADEARALDLLYHADGQVSEAASASVYFVRGETILAPRDRVLRGTIGTLVLELAKYHYEIVYGEVSLEDARGADEVFLTSTTRGIVPIVQLDDLPVGTGTPGPVTRDLMARYHEAVFGD